MNKSVGVLRDWAPAAAAVVAVLLSAGYGFSKRSLAQERISEARGTGEALCAASDRARVEVLSPEQSRTVEAEMKDLEARMVEALKPGIVQPALIASAQRVGLRVHEVTPVSVAMAPASNGNRNYPAYRVSVQGSYRQIAEYLQSCKSLRVPARATSFRLAASDSEGQKDTGVLKAEITMESFLPLTTQARPRAGN